MRVARSSLRGRRVLRHGFRALGYSVLGKLAREQQAHGRLDLARGQGRLLVVAGSERGSGIHVGCGEAFGVCVRARANPVNSVVVTGDDKGIAGCV